MSFAKSVLSVGSLTLASRVFGFIRELLTAYYLGAGPVADAFFVAFKLPNFFRRFIGEGAFSAAFVPKFSTILTKQSKEEALAFSSNIFSWMLVILILLIVVFELFMPTVISVLAPGFRDVPELASLAVEFAHITMPYLFFIVIVALMGGILNSLDRFSEFAAAPIILNICFILSLVFLTRFFPNAGFALAYGVLIAGVCQFLWMVLGLFRAKANLKIVRPRFNQQTKHLLKIMVPGLVGAGVTQINILVDVLLASLLPTGSISYLYYADRLNQLPLGVIGIAFATAMLPLLTRQFRSGDLKRANNTMNRSLEYALLISLPAAIGLGVLSFIIMTALFERGAFGAFESLMSSQALSAYAVGLPAYILIKVLSPAFYAHEDTLTPVKTGAVALIVNLALNLILMQYFAHVGLALATAIAAWVNASLLLVILVRRGHFKPDNRLLKNLLKILFSSCVMAASLVFLKGLDFPLGEIKVALLLAQISLGALIFFTTSYITGALNISELKSVFVKKKGS